MTILSVIAALSKREILAIDFETPGSGGGSLLVDISNTYGRRELARFLVGEGKYKLIAFVVPKEK